MCLPSTANWSSQQCHPERNAALRAAKRRLVMDLELRAGRTESFTRAVSC
jgi:hypothetical protein